ncbi:unnamed protein product [Soboliphyme baturini]|uniref:26S proteasome non-ATPase regulatory subunit 6 n=1 Tax=Soboliphyme baturini TaxID=241478 RepID=A0A183I8S7_9BILA|nr:unnamed protein product [Soboliphyme baturini]
MLESTVASVEDRKRLDLQIAQWQFLLMQPEYDEEEKKKVRSNFMDVVIKQEMAPYYEYACSEMGIEVDQMLLKKLKDSNEEKLKSFDAKIEDAEKNLGESEVREAYARKAEYLCSIGDKEKALTAFSVTYAKSVGAGKKIDIIFTEIRLGLFFMDHTLIAAKLGLAQELMEQGGDWDRKNALKAYEGLYRMSIRDFKKAANLFLDAVSTFTCYELMSYEKLVFYAVITSMIALERNELRDRVVKCAEIIEQLHGQAELRQYLFSLYECDYAGFFRGLANMETKLKFDRFLSPHYRFYTRSMRAKVYKQLLSSYRSLTLQYMAEAFGVSEKFIDKELHQFIASGILHCKIDRVRGVVETSQLDSKNWQYESIIRDGDVLLNRIQKLSRVINMLK